MPLVEAVEALARRPLRPAPRSGVATGILPGQLNDATIQDVMDLAKGGDAAARTCMKLLKEPRFKK